MFSGLLKILTFGLILRPALFLLLGLNLRGQQHLPRQGPAVLAANHNSHLDTVLLMSLFPLRMLPRVRPVAAADYFLKNRLLAWFALHVIGIIPIQRAGGRSRDQVLHRCYAALRRGDVLIIFPEGSRGEPERLERFKKGVGYMLERQPNAQLIPAFIYGAGRALPKGESVLVPFTCDVCVGEPLVYQDGAEATVEKLEAAIKELSAQCHTENWV